jgi:vacuolar-type H+-ATPase subunit I/STV1
MHMAAPAISPDVATAAAWTPSRRLQAAAAAEDERLGRELARLARRESELIDELGRVKAARRELEKERAVLQRLSEGVDSFSDKGRLHLVGEERDLAGRESATTEIRGARIRETAVRLLAVVSEPHEAVHYRDWFELLTSRGYRPAGKDPLATFLTQVSRSPVVQRTTSAGMYTLDRELPHQLRRQLQELRLELSEVEALHKDASVHDVTTARRRRTEVAARIQATEKTLAEALRSLGEPDAPM